MEKGKYTIDNIPCVPWYEVQEGRDEGKIKAPTLYFIEFLAHLGYYYAFYNCKSSKIVHQLRIKLSD